jgi:hypothetical protein
MNEDLRKERAKMARALADKADPFMKRRLIDLAARFEQAPRPVTSLPSSIPSRRTQNSFILAAIDTSFRDGRRTDWLATSLVSRIVHEATPKGA